MILLQKILAPAVILCSCLSVTAQEDKKIHLTTGVGINKIQGPLKNTFRSTIAFNSGFEKAFGKKWFGQLELNFNSLRYDQQEKDETSGYLIRNTSSSLFMIGANWGYDFRFGSSKWFASLYGGSGYLNIGKPRAIVNESENIVTQKTIRKGGILAKGGSRVGVNTGSGFLQTIYFDISGWTTTLKVEDERFRSISAFLGIRMAMHSDNKLVKRHLKAVRKLH